MPIPRVYRTTGETAIATYSYTDIAEGTGVAKMYGGSTKVSSEAATTFFLSSSQIASNTIASSAGVTRASGWNLVFEHDYDVKFNLPKNIKGKLRASLTAGKEANSTTNDVDVYVKLMVRKVDSSGTHEIADATSEVVYIATVAANTPKSRTFNVEVDIPTVQHFKKGDILRVTLMLYGDTIGTETTNIGYGFDPADRNDDQYAGTKIIEDVHTTQFIVYVPFVIDL